MGLAQARPNYNSESILRRYETFHQLLATFIMPHYITLYVFQQRSITLLFLPLSLQHVKLSLFDSAPLCAVADLLAPALF